jgi:hypothetical protein
VLEQVIPLSSLWNAWNVLFNVIKMDARNIIIVIIIIFIGSRQQQQKSAVKLTGRFNS